MPEARYLPLVNYRRYRLRITNEEDPRFPSQHELIKIWENFRSELGEHFTFDRDDPIFIPHFLYSIADPLDNRRMKEAVGFNFLPRMLRGSANIEFESTRTASATSDRPVNDWPSAVNCLLEVYAQYEYLRSS